MIEILAPGVMSSLQDLGRSGYANMGISQSGALDSLSLRLGNYLLNNPANSATLEIIFSPAEFLFHSDAYIAVTGTPCTIWIDDQLCLLGWRLFIQKGQRLKIQPRVCGMSNYLAVQGGFAAPRMMNSYATDIKSGYGGHNKQGATLKKGDHLALTSLAAKHYPIKPIGIKLPHWDNILHVIPAPEYHEFTKTAQLTFWQTDWTVSTKSNRMGLRLQGQSLERLVTTEISSQGGFAGIIQVPPNGQPIILAAEAQTTAGYPRIGVIIKADLWKLGQVCLGKSVRFVKVHHTDAVHRLQKQKYYLQRIKYGVKSHYETPLN